MTLNQNRFLGMHTTWQWLLMLFLGFMLVFLVPILNAYTSEDSFFHIGDFMVKLIAKIMCYALVAMALDLVWGYTGILSLCHALFFALGGYAMGMHLMLMIGKEGVYRSNLPDFMVFLDWKELPWFWQGFDNFAYALLMVVLVPGTVAFIFGFFAFRSRIKGVYFSIVTQAMTYAAMLLFFRNNTGFGGNNGLTDFKRILGFTLQDKSTVTTLYIMTGLILISSYLACRYITMSKLGRVLTGIRDAETRVIFTGYDAFRFKLFAWTFSAILCGIAGALFVLQVGIINPEEMKPSNSIEMVIWVAVGGRGTLFGAILGAFVVNGAKSYLTAEFENVWLYFLGLLFVLTTIFLPNGLVGLFRRNKKVSSE
jgi:urea transport system permease protein